jgi:hypothetical protein
MKTTDLSEDVTYLSNIEFIMNCADAADGGEAHG